MTDAPDPTNIRWGEVRERMHAERDGILQSLATAKPEDISILQGRYWALSHVIDWFERGAMAEKAFTTPTPT